MLKLRGIHHITAIATDPQQNLDFYTHLLGLRLVKRTVNFDDPGTYHLYFGDNVGHPGTILTFFPWPGAQRGRRGNSQVVATSFAVRPGAIDFWKDRLARAHVFAEELAEPRFGERTLRFSDPDGMVLELIETTQLREVNRVELGDIDDESALKGFHAPTLQLSSVTLTEQLLTGTFGFERQNELGHRQRFSLGPASAGAQMIDLVQEPEAGFGHVSAGTVHHIAFRAANDEEQLEWRELLTKLGLHVTPVIDRHYFHSVYFREPGGILFEIATDNPGFAVDEPVEHLGENLKLPPQYEENRDAIARTLPSITLHTAESK